MGLLSVGCTGGSSFWAHESDSGSYNSALYREQVRKLTNTLVETGNFESEFAAKQRAREIINEDADHNLRRHQAGQDNYGGFYTWEKELGEDR